MKGIVAPGSRAALATQGAVCQFAKEQLQQGGSQQAGEQDEGNARALFRWDGPKQGHPQLGISCTHLAEMPGREHEQAGDPDRERAGKMCQKPCCQ